MSAHGGCLPREGLYNLICTPRHLDRILDTLSEAGILQIKKVKFRHYLSTTTVADAVNINKSLQ